MADQDFSYDPVTAVDEASATGRTAEIFAEIRETMEIPLVTSIWRGLAGMEDSLETVWELTRPIYASGAAIAALNTVVNEATLPIPQALAPTALRCAGLSENDLEQARSIIAAYNRSNGMNMVALSALINPPAGAPLDLATPERPHWPPFPVLLAQQDINEDTWSLVRHCNAFGSSGVDANVATLWRHLAHWPALLAMIHTAMTPLQTSGAISKATAEVVDLSAREGSRMAHLRVDQPAMTDQARGTITGYVTTQTQVVRMVTVGHALARWLG